MANEYRVAWSEDALQDLLEVWNESRERERVRRAGDALDALLATNPFSQQFEVIHNQGPAIVDGVGIDFEIFPADNKVVINTCWRSD
jgi:plasmid stabilization system protein ParE